MCVLYLLALPQSWLDRFVSNQVLARLLVVYSALSLAVVTFVHFRDSCALVISCQNVRKTEI